MKNNAKKRKLYEAFIETLPLLTSLEVPIFFVLQHYDGTLSTCSVYSENHCKPNMFSCTGVRENEGSRRAVHQGVQ